MKATTLLIALAALALITWAIRTHSPGPTPRPEPRQATALETKPVRMPRLPAPRLPPAADVAEPATSYLRGTNVLARLFKGEEVRLTREQVEGYLQENHRRAESLLAAFRATQDVKLLREALEKYPGDPRVNYAAYFAPVCNGDLKNEFSPEERRKLLDAFKQSAPDNALADYISARDYFASGQTDRAVQELQAAAGKSKFQDYTAEFMQDAEDAYRAAGYAEVEARAMGTLSQPLPDLAALKNLTRDLSGLASLYQQAGDPESAHAALQLGLDLGQRVGQPPEGPQTSIHELVSIKIQQLILEGMDPNSAYSDTGRTIKDRLADLGRRRDELVQMGHQAADLLPTLTEQELGSFMERMKVLGEWQAWQWLKNKKGL